MPFDPGNPAAAYGVPAASGPGFFGGVLTALSETPEESAARISGQAPIAKGNVPYAGGMAPQGAPPAPPGAAAEVPPAPNPDPYGQVVEANTLGAGGGPAHQVGLSPADKDRALELVQAEEKNQGRTEGAAQSQEALAQEAREHSAQVLAESKAATDQMHAQLADDQSKRAGITSEAKEKQTRIDAQLAAMQAQGVDPNRYWQSQSTPQKIGAALAVALGGIGAGALGAHGTRGENVALGIVNQAIAQDMDAQKTNLQRQLAIMDRRGDLAEKGFDRDLAMAKAEQESHMTAYTIAAQDIQRRAATFAEGSQAQSQALKLADAIRNEGDQRTEAHNDKIYALSKGAERVVGGGGNNLAKKLGDLSLELGKSHPEWTADQARNKAAATLGLPLGGAAEPVAAVKGAGLGRGLVPMAKYQSAAEAAKNIEKEVGNATAGYLSPAQQAKIDAYNKEIEEAGGQPVNTSIGHVLTGAAVAGARATRAGLELHARNIHNAGGTVGEEDEDIGTPD